MAVSEHILLSVTTSGRAGKGRPASSRKAAGSPPAAAARKQAGAKAAKARTPAPAKKAGSARRATPAPARPVETSARPADPSEEMDSGKLGWVIANHVRSRRLEIGLNVGQLADRSGISKGMLSKIENAQTSPSLSTLERLASALDMPVTSMFRGLAEERDAVFVKAGSGPEIVRQGTRSGHSYELLGSLRGPYKRIEPLLVSLTETAEVFPQFQHGGIEMLYMLTGVMDYYYGKQVYRMEPGDTLQFEGDIPHGPTLLVKVPIEFLSITVYADRT